MNEQHLLLLSLNFIVNKLFIAQNLTRAQVSDWTNGCHWSRWLRHCSAKRQHVSVRKLIRVTQNHVSNNRPSRGRPLHQINFMDDGFSAENNGASERNLFLFFLKNNLISPKNEASEEATIFFSKNLISPASESDFFSKKET